MTNMPSSYVSLGFSYGTSEADSLLMFCYTLGTIKILSQTGSNLRDSVPVESAWRYHR
jgi:hypothetical protein